MYVTSQHNEGLGRQKTMQESRGKTIQESNGDDVTSQHNEDPGKTKKNMQELLLKKQCRNQMEMRSLQYIMKIRGRPKKNNAGIAT